MTRTKFLALLVALLPTLATAEPTVSVGLGKGAFGEHGTPFERAAAVGYQHSFQDGLFLRPEAGWFMDISGNGKSSAFVAQLVGVQSRARMGAEMHVAIGPAYLQNPDEVLGGHFQFSLEGGAGVSDKNFFIGMVWKHLSSAGIYQPNHGRDFIMTQVRMQAF